MSPEQARALAQLDATELRRAAEHLGGHDALRTRVWLDREFAPLLSQAILDCVATRAHFASKFDDIDRWLLTREAAEQATASAIARWRAGYLKARFPALKSLVELGTGVGGDSVYLARHFGLTGYEADEARAELARANLTALSPAAENWAIHARRVDPAELSGELLFADPARRAGNGRTFEPEQWSPPLSSLLSSRFQALMVKAAPGLDLTLLPPNMEAHFLSLAGDLKEAMLLRPGREPLRHAWLWPAGAMEPLHRQGAAAKVGVRQPAPGDFLHDPDPALTRSGLLNGLASELEAGVVHPKIGYLCGPAPCRDGWASSFHILEALPLHWKRLGQALLATEWSELEYLSRGVPFSQEEVMRQTSKVRKRMKGRAGGRGAVIVYRDERDYRVLLAERCPSL